MLASRGNGTDSRGVRRRRGAFGKWRVTCDKRGEGAFQSDVLRKTTSEGEGACSPTEAERPHLPLRGKLGWMTPRNRLETAGRDAPPLSRLPEHRSILTLFPKGGAPVKPLGTDPTFKQRRWGTRKTTRNCNHLGSWRWSPATSHPHFQIESRSGPIAGLVWSCSRLRRVIDKIICKRPRLSTVHWATFPNAVSP